jgi:hypothetical protein
MWSAGSLRVRGPARGGHSARFAAFFRVLSALVTVPMVPSCLFLLARWPIGTHRAKATPAPPTDVAARRDATSGYFEMLPRYH